MRHLRELAGIVRALDRARLDQLLALVLGTASQLQTWLSGSVGDRLATSLLGLALWGAVAFRRRWPLAALLLGCASVSLDAAFGGALVDTVQVSLIAGVLCFYGAGAFLERRTSPLALGAGVALLLPQILLTPHAVSNLFFEPVVMGFLPWLCGRWVRERGVRVTRFRELSEELDRQREHHADAAAELERTRVARELHDLIGHCLSVIVLQAGGARAVLHSDPERAREAMLVVERAGHEALGDMGHLLDVFGVDEAADRFHPQPGLANIEELVQRTRSAGLETDLTVSGSSRVVPPGLGLCAYRIVQEGLTNTIKHSGAAHASVRLSWLANRLEIEVADDGRGPQLQADGQGGHGIVGMHERAALHRGSVLAGPGKAGGFRVLASLPLTEEAVA